MRIRDHRRGRIWPRTREEDLQERRWSRRFELLKILVAIPATMCLTLLLLWLGITRVSTSGLDAELLIVLAGVLASAFFLRFLVRLFRAAWSRDVTTPSPALPSLTDLPFNDPRQRFPRWLRVTVGLLALPLLFAALFFSLFTSFFLVEELYLPTLLAPVFGLAGYLFLRLGIGRLVHALTGR